MATTNDQIILQSSDELEFPVAKGVAIMSTTVKNMLEDLEGMSQHPIPLPNVTGAVLGKVIEYCQYHFEHHPVPASKDDEKIEKDKLLGEWDQKFCAIDKPMLFELVLAANYLDIKDLLDVTCLSIASMLKGKSPEEIRKVFNIKNDFTPEEEEQVKKENEWCEEK